MSPARGKLIVDPRALIVALAALAFVVALSAAAFIYYDLQVESILTTRQSTVVDTEIQLLRLIDKEEGRRNLIRAIARRTGFANDDFAIQALISKDGKYLAGDVDWPKDIVANGTWQRISTYARKGVLIDGYGRALVLSDGAQVLVGRDRTAQRRVERTLGQAMFAMVFVLLAGTVALGLYLNQLILRRIEAISSSANLILEGDATTRFPNRQETEFDRLGGVLNDLLDRNSNHLQQMRMVTDAIAHDLRQPLQTIRARLDQAMAAKDELARTDAFLSANAEMDLALSTFDSLLEVARAESGLGKDAFSEIDVETLVRDVIELFEPLAEDKGQKIEATLSPVHLLGQNILLRQSLGNLLQNAIKFAPDNSTIKVTLVQKKDRALLMVEDHGPGIPSSQHALALRPFGRLTRDANSTGKGLGLALVAACIKLHEGALTLEDAQPGLRVRVDLPVTI